MNTHHHKPPEPDPIAGHRYTLPTVRESPRGHPDAERPPAKPQRARVLASLIALPDRPDGNR